MHFIVGQAKKSNADPILTFYQPLYQKAYEIQWKESENSELKNLVILCLSRDLCEVLETIYGSDTVPPHMLSGSTTSRAFRGHLIFSGVLYAAIISDVYEYPLQDQFSAEESDKDLFSNKIPESKLD